MKVYFLIFIFLILQCTKKEVQVTPQKNEIALDSLQQEKMKNLSTYFSIYQSDSAYIKPNVKLYSKPSLSSNIIFENKETGLALKEADESQEGFRSFLWNGKKVYIPENQFYEQAFRSQSDVSVIYFIDKSSEKYSLITKFKNGTIQKLDLTSLGKFDSFNGYSLGNTKFTSGDCIILEAWGDEGRKRSNFFIKRNGEEINFFRNENLNTFLQRQKLLAETYESLEFKTDIAQKSSTDSIKNNTNYEVLGKVKDTIKYKDYYKVSYNGKKGYAKITGLSLLAPLETESVKSNVYFTLKKKTDSTSLLVAKKGSKILDQIVISNINNGNPSLYPLSSMGLDTDGEFLGISYFAEECGIAGGDIIIFWDGNKLNLLAKNVDMGDGGYFTDDKFLFPFQTGSKTKIEQIALEGYNNFITKDYQRNYTFENNRLVEQEPTTKKILDLFHPKKELLKYKEWNQDNKSYVIVALRSTEYNYQLVILEKTADKKLKILHSLPLKRPDESKEPYIVFSKDKADISWVDLETEDNSSQKSKITYTINNSSVKWNP